MLAFIKKKIVLILLLVTVINLVLSILGSSNIFLLLGLGVMLLGFISEAIFIGVFKENVVMFIVAGLGVLVALEGIGNPSEGRFFPGIVAILLAGVLMNALKPKSKVNLDSVNEKEEENNKPIKVIN